jgi:hypothetical protein
VADLEGAGSPFEKILLAVVLFLSQDEHCARHSTAAETPIKVHIQATLRSRTQPLEGYYGRGTLTSVLL